MALAPAVAGRVAAQVPVAQPMAQQPLAPAPDRGPKPQPLRAGPTNDRLHNYLHDLTSPATMIGVAGGPLVGYLREEPSLRDSDALAEQMLSRAGQAAVQLSVRHGLAALMDRSTSYQPCDCRGLGPRIGHALLETFTDHRADGSRALSVPRIAGAYAGSFSRMAWEHDGNAGDVAVSTTLSFGFSALVNIARELSGVGR
ncbi:MAG: hypothetical protein ACAI18_20565 [Gemmatimonadales bacterium]